MGQELPVFPKATVLPKGIVTQVAFGWEAFIVQSFGLECSASWEWNTAQFHISGNNSRTVIVIEVKPGAFERGESWLFRKKRNFEISHQHKNIL